MKPRVIMVAGSVSLTLGFAGFLIYLGVVAGLTRAGDRQPIGIRAAGHGTDQFWEMVVFEISNRTSSTYGLFNIATEVLTNGASSIEEWPMFTFDGESMGALDAHDAMKWSLRPDPMQATRVRLAFVKFPPPWLRKVEDMMRLIGLKPGLPRNGEIAGPIVPRGTNSNTRSGKSNP